MPTQTRQEYDVRDLLPCLLDAGPFDEYKPLARELGILDKLVVRNNVVDIENYVHRIGRTGRIGKDGIAISFATPEAW